MAVPLQSGTEATLQMRISLIIQWILATLQSTVQRGMPMANTRLPSGLRTAARLAGVDDEITRASMLPSVCGLGQRVAPADGRTPVVRGDEAAADMAGPNPQRQDHRRVRGLRRIEARLDAAHDRRQIRFRIEQPQRGPHGDGMALRVPGGNRTSAIGSMPKDCPARGDSMHPWHTDQVSPVPVPTTDERISRDPTPRARPAWSGKGRPATRSARPPQRAASLLRPLPVQSGSPGFGPSHHLTWIRHAGALRETR